MKKLIALISAIAVMGTMSLTSFAAITATPAENATLTAIDGGYSATLTSAETNTQTTILAVKGAEITTTSIQYINQLAQDSEVAINFDLKDTLAVGETVDVYMGGDAISKTLVGTIANVADPVEKFTVKFVSEGATLSEVAYDKDAAIVVPENPTKEADAEYTYAFAGWYVEGDAEQTVVDLADAKATANVTYVAKFTATAIPSEPEEPEYTLGDVDNNGTINATDAGWALSKYGDSSTVLPGGDASADVDGNGTINATDAGWILTKYGDSNTVFPAEEQ